MVSRSAPWPCRWNESRPVNASFVFTSIVRTLSRVKGPLVSTRYVREAPDGMGPPAPVKTSATPGSAPSADSAGPLFASSAIAATGCVAISPTPQTCAWFEWTTKSGGESGCEPGGPGPGGVKFVMITRQLRSPPGDEPAPAGIRRAAPTRAAASALKAIRLIFSPSSDVVGDARREILRCPYQGVNSVLDRPRSSQGGSPRVTVLRRDWRLKP